MIDLRKLGAIDIVFLGPKVILAEYTLGVVFSLALGIFVLIRQHSGWQIALGLYFVCLAINYTPMLSWAMKIRNKQTARLELGDELMDKSGAMARYRRVSLVLLVPLMPLFLIVPRPTWIAQFLETAVLSKEQIDWSACPWVERKPGRAKRRSRIARYADAG